MKNTWLSFLPAARTRTAERDALHLPASDFRRLIELFGPSLGLWRGAEIAALRHPSYDHPILDLGCGDGIVTCFVLRNVDFGLDPDQKVLAKAKQRGIYRELIARSAEDSGLPEASIGTVLSNSVLEHIPDLDRVLESVARLLRPGGRFIFTTPTGSFSRWLALPSARYAAWRNRRLLHLNLWSLERWKECLARVGLEIVSVRPYLRHRLEMLWDWLDLLESIWIARRRAFGVLWKRMPGAWLDAIARAMSCLDLGSSPPGAGHLVIARKI